MKNYLFLFLICSSFPLFGQDSVPIRNNEFGLGFYTEDIIGFHLSTRTNTQKPDFFPSNDSLDKLAYQGVGSMGNGVSIALNYTHWLTDPGVKRRARHGIRFTLGGLSTYSWYESWNNTYSETYDTLIVQSTGVKYPLDSVHTDSYSSNATADIVRFGVGYQLLIPTERRVEFLLGVNALYNQAYSQRTNFSQYRFSYATIPSELGGGMHYKYTEPKTTSEKTRTQLFSTTVQFPFEIRIKGKKLKKSVSKSRLYQRLYNLNYDKWSIGLQFTPGICFTVLEKTNYVNFSYASGITYAYRF